MKEYHQLDEIQKDLQNGSLSCVQLVAHYLDQIKQKAHLNVFIEVFEEEAISKAESIDEKIKENTAGDLAGLVFGIKDLLCYQGHAVTGASQILSSYKSPFSATAIERLISADAIIIGRQNCDEFGMGSSNENSHFGATLNAADNNRVPGGSSGASAVAVQSGMCLASLGTDTGGSVRQPASFCGVVGIKPTYSRVSRWGLLAYASSFDTIGVLTHQIKDAELILETISGHDPKDATSAKVASINSKHENPAHYRIAYPSNVLDNQAVQLEIREAYGRMIKTLREKGHEVDEVTLEFEEFLLPVYYILTMAEASTNLSRYDGVHFGKRSEQADDLDSLLKNSRTEGFGAEVRRRIMLGTYILSAEYHDAYFKKAQQLRRLIRKETKGILETYDVILTPTAPTTAFLIGEHRTNPLEMYMEDIFTVQASVAGIPAISIPVYRKKDELPFGLQIMSNSFREDKIFAFSSYLETLIETTLA